MGIRQSMQNETSPAEAGLSSAIIDSGTHFMFTHLPGKFVTARYNSQLTGPAFTSGADVMNWPISPRILVTCCEADSAASAES